MKPTQPNRLARAISTASIALFSFVFFISCASKIQFANSTVVPTAEGSVKVKKDGNNNYSIDINIKHLANPNKLVPSKSLYVVWAETKENGTKNLGRLNTSSSLL